MSVAFSSFICVAASGTAAGAAVGRSALAAGLFGIVMGAFLLPLAAARADTPDAPARPARPQAAAAAQPAPEAAAPDRTEETRRAVDRIFTDPLSGVVVNRTVTVLGRDFYQHFSTLWRQSPESLRYSISVHERPTARFGSEIWVQYRQQRIFHTFLPPARSATRAISEVAVQHVRENISRRELERLTTRNPDLGPEEL